MAPKNNINDWLQQANFNDQKNGDTVPTIALQYPDGRTFALEYQEAFGGQIVGNLEHMEDLVGADADCADLTLKIDDRQWIKITDFTSGPSLGARNKCIKIEVGDVYTTCGVFESMAQRAGKRSPVIEYRVVESGTKLAAKFVDRRGITWILMGTAPVENN